MREIKFRARNANVPPCWIYGYFIIERDSCYIINNNGKFQVRAGTESEYTGLKDKNGKEIYEGDIITGEPAPSWQTKAGSPKEIKYLIKWQQTERCIGLSAVSFLKYPFNEDKFTYHISDDCRIIGNIYENKDLLQNNDAHTAS